jgi:hypothetical protein
MRPARRRHQADEVEFRKVTRNGGGVPEMVVTGEFLGCRLAAGPDEGRNVKASREGNVPDEFPGMKRKFILVSGGVAETRWLMAGSGPDDHGGCGRARRRDRRCRPATGGTGSV